MLRGTTGDDFNLPIEQDGAGNWVLFDGVRHIYEWTIAYGTYLTLQQTRWFVVLLRRRDKTAARVVARVFFEDSLPACGVELRDALEKSIMNRSVAMKIKRGVSHDVVRNRGFALF
ncbi:hypothetical protein CALCODRAFT_357275 [Calocera cornea HHB12733]|uniref:Uncharacterized protein n=1 Tax=Calocera cornea HHB12733 TaxID=1353952 RepID=A0A165EP49_9BASI|nr:hypothetical protein CALCODRAFT_357275 [Calocera cornea HHB12733]